MSGADTVEHENFDSRRTLRWVRAALRETTEVLARELRNPGNRAPDWSRAQWTVAQAAAAIHGVSALLADGLRWQGPAPWLRFLAEQKEHTARRFECIAELLRAIDADARREGVAFVGLKGTALHAIGIYAAGERPMADVDLLVEPQAEHRAIAVLVRLGFHETFRTWKHRVFEQQAGAPVAPLGEHAANAIKIELHGHIGEELAARRVSLAEPLFPYPTAPGINAYPSQAALVLHLLLHAAGALCFRGLRLLQLHDIARLAHRLSAREWDEVLSQGARATEGGLWWAYPPLALVARYYGCIPDRVLASAARDCHPPLRQIYRRRTLADASLCDLWIRAFPGIEWSRSPRELLAYAAARVAPSAETIRSRRELAAAQPRVSGGPWAELSQGRRVLRWLTSPQARHETLAPVRAAFAART